MERGSQFAGYLTKLKKGMRRSHKRWFVLQLARNEVSYSTSPEDARAGTQIARFSTREIRELRLGTKEQPARGFQFEVTLVHFPKGSKTKANVKYELVADTEKEEDEWFARLVMSTLGLYVVDHSSICYVAERFHSKGDMKRAKECYLEAKESMRKAKKMKADYAKVLNNLAVLEHHAGNFDTAEPYVIEARDVLSSVKGQRDPDYARSLNILATLYEAKARYAEAEPLYRQALETWDALSATRHVDYATCMSNLGSLLQRMGEHAKAEPYLKKVLTMRGTQLGEKHPEYASALNSLANLYWVMGSYEKAEPLYLKALEIRKNQYGETHRSYASSLQHCAGSSRLFVSPDGALSRVSFAVLPTEVVSVLFLSTPFPHFRLSHERFFALQRITHPLYLVSPGCFTCLQSVAFTFSHLSAAPLSLSSHLSIIFSLNDQ